MKNKILIIITIIGLAFTFSTIYSFYSIYQSVFEISMKAKGNFAFDTVESLIELIKSEKYTYSEKNKAIWALGQIGDKRALPILKQLDTDEIQNKPLNSKQYIVQYSVEKAIKQINSSFIATRWMYKNI